MRVILLHYFNRFLGLIIKISKNIFGLDSTLFMKYYTFGSDAEELLVVGL